MPAVPPVLPPPRADGSAMHAKAPDGPSMSHTPVPTTPSTAPPAARPSMLATVISHAPAAAEKAIQKFNYSLFRLFLWKSEK